MDCRTARLLLDFVRPQAHELEAEEARALESHLDQCPDCHSQARGEQQLDACLSKAMRQVEIPAGLRDQLLTRLESARGDWYRQRFAHNARLLATAAAVLLLGWTGWHWLMERMATPVDPHCVINAISNDATEDPRPVYSERSSGWVWKRRSRVTSITICWLALRSWRSCPAIRVAKWRVFSSFKMAGWHRSTSLPIRPSPAIFPPSSMAAPSRRNCCLRRANPIASSSSTMAITSIGCDRRLGPHNNPKIGATSVRER